MIHCDSMLTDLTRCGLKVVKRLFDMNYPSVLSLQDENFRVVAHRGIPSEEDENTIESYILAQKYGFTWGEGDARCTKDGSLVNIHDCTIDRTTNGSGFVKDFTFEEIQKVSTKNGHSIPSYRRQIEVLGQSFSHNIELKSLGTAIPVAKMLEDFFVRGWNSTNFLVSSFQHNELELFRWVMPSVETGVLIAHGSSDLGFAHNLYAEWINVDIYVVDTNPNFVDICHNEGFKIGVWTIKSYSDALRMKLYGVDLIFTNCP